MLFVCFLHYLFPPSPSGEGNILLCSSPGIFPPNMGNMDFCLEQECKAGKRIPLVDLFYITAINHKTNKCRPYFTILDHSGPFWTLLDKFQNIQDHFGPFWTILDHFDHFGQLLTFVDYFLCYYLEQFLTTLNNVEPFKTILDHNKQFWSPLLCLGSFGSLMKMYFLVKMCSLVKTCF